MHIPIIVSIVEMRSKVDGGGGAHMSSCVFHSTPAYTHITLASACARAMELLL